MKLQAYLDRIHYQGDINTDISTLRQIHHQHLLHIPYENLSVLLGEKLNLDSHCAFEKIVHQQRGGWCYEMNGLLQWALQQIGFDVTRISGGVLRSKRGDNVLGNHLLLAVKINQQTWLADVGFGDGLREPILLQEAAITQGGLHYSLARIGNGFWRFHNHSLGGASDFDFTYEPAAESLLAEQCERLQSAADSPFVLNLACQKFTPHSIEILLGKIRRSISPAGETKRLLTSPKQLQTELKKVFNIDRNIEQLWPSIEDRHRRLFG